MLKLYRYLSQEKVADIIFRGKKKGVKDYKILEIIVVGVATCAAPMNDYSFLLLFFLLVHFRVILFSNSISRHMH